MGGANTRWVWSGQGGWGLDTVGGARTKWWGQDKVEAWGLDKTKGTWIHPSPVLEGSRLLPDRTEVAQSTGPCLDSGTNIQSSLRLATAENPNFLGWGFQGRGGMWNTQGKLSCPEL